MVFVQCISDIINHHYCHKWLINLCPSHFKGLEKKPLVLFILVTSYSSKKQQKNKYHLHRYCIKRKTRGIFIDTKAAIRQMRVNLVALWKLWVFQHHQKFEIRFRRFNFLDTRYRYMKVNYIIQTFRLYDVRPMKGVMLSLCMSQ